MSEASETCGTDVRSFVFSVDCGPEPADLGRSPTLWLEVLFKFRRDSLIQHMAAKCAQKPGKGLADVIDDGMHMRTFRFLADLHAAAAGCASDDFELVPVCNAHDTFRSRLFPTPDGISGRAGFIGSGYVRASCRYKPLFNLRVELAVDARIRNACCSDDAVGSAIEAGLLPVLQKHAAIEASASGYAGPFKVDRLALESVTHNIKASK